MNLFPFNLNILLYLIILAFSGLFFIFLLKSKQEQKKLIYNFFDVPIELTTLHTYQSCNNKYLNILIPTKLTSINKKNFKSPQKISIPLYLKLIMSYLSEKYKIENLTFKKILIDYIKTMSYYELVKSIIEVKIYHKNYNHTKIKLENLINSLKEVNSLDNNDFKINSSIKINKRIDMINEDIKIEQYRRDGSRFNIIMSITKLVGNYSILGILNTFYFYFDNYYTNDNNNNE